MRRLLLLTALATAALGWEVTAGTSEACVCPGRWCGHRRICPPAAVAPADSPHPAAPINPVAVSAGLTLGMTSALSLVALFWKS